MEPASLYVGKMIDKPSELLSVACDVECTVSIFPGHVIAVRQSPLPRSAKNSAVVLWLITQQ